MKYDVVVGIEIHLELKTKSKMFSGASFDFKKAANSQVNEIDFAFPGTLPSVNMEAVKKALAVCLALNLEIDPLLKFDRKNYFYSDLPKGFQITQQFHPLGKNGYLTIQVDGIDKKIGINRIHMEEDTAKQFHFHDETLIDFNRAGAPLIEIVSDPDMSSGEEASQYVDKLRQTLLYLDISDCKMEEGSMRCDVNISLKEKGSSTFGTKVEIKNLNSINNIRQAIDYESKRQASLLDAGGTIIQETRRFDEKTQTTISMRKKEGAVDYKYFPEPNIFPIRLSDAFIASVQENLVELPDAKARRYREQFQLNDYDTNLLIANKQLASYFEKAMETAKNAKLCCNLLNSEFIGLLVKNNQNLETTLVQAENFAKLVNLIDSQSISSKQGKEVLEYMLSGQDPDLIVAEKGFKQVSNTDAIAQLVDEVLAEQPQSIVDYHNGKDRALGFLVGQLMKKSKGQANPALASQLMKQALERLK